MTDKTRGILLVLGFLTVSATAVGCGGSDGDDRAQFSGTWLYMNSSVTFACPGQADQTGPYGLQKVWNEGVTSDLVDMTPSFIDGVTQCFYTFDVKNKVATIKAAQTCAFFDVTGQEFDDVPSAWTFTLTSASSAEEVFMAAFDGCTETGMATLKKVAASN